MGGKTYTDNIRAASREVDLSTMTPTERVQLIVDHFKTEEQRFHTPLSQGSITLLEASTDGPSHASTLWEFDNHDYWGNGMSTLHGGAHATIFDFLTSFTIPILSRPDFWQLPGVSRTLNVTYLRPAPSGEPVLIECEVVHIGKRMCVLKGTMRRKSDGALVSTCEHHKVNNDPPQASKM